MKITLNGAVKGDIEVVSNATVAHLKNAIHSQWRKYYPERQRLVVRKGNEQIVLRDGLLTSYEGITLEGPNVITLKDLGPQISWRSTYLFEYTCPFVVYLFFYLQPEFIYGSHSHNQTPTQTLALLCWLGHFGKRLFESAFVHTFSGESLGLQFVAWNSLHYFCGGLFIGYYVNSPWYSYTISPSLQMACLGIYILAEFGNGWVHLQHRLSRPPGSTARILPKGFIYDLLHVSFPNYFCEVVIWLVWNIMFFSHIFGIVFFLAGAWQMKVWAVKKHKAYEELFNGENGREKYPKRWAMIPFFV